MPQPADSAAPCATCQRQPLPLTRVVAPFLYEFPLSAAIQAFKFRRRFHYLPALASLLCDAAETAPADVDALLPVPLHQLRMLTRGFNQARALALPVGRRTGLPVLDAVSRCRHTPYQSGLAYADRQRNLEAAFSIRHEIRARHVMLVDDVMTTGATVVQLSRLLLANGVEKVSVLALARAQAD